jgi:hypothetical protein
LSQTRGLTQVKNLTRQRKVVHGKAEWDDANVQQTRVVLVLVDERNLTRAWGSAAWSTLRKAWPI